MEIEKLVKKMLVEEPFYGFMLTSVERRFSSAVRTLGVYFNEEFELVILINKKYYDSLTDEQQLAVFKHEMLHVAFHHPTMSTEFPDKDRFNYAADMEVNSYINGLPNDCVLCGDYGMAPKLGAMAYYRELTRRHEERKAKLEETIREMQEIMERLNDNGIDVDGCGALTQYPFMQDDNDDDDEPDEDEDNNLGDYITDEDIARINDDLKRLTEEKEVLEQPEFQDDKLVDDHDIWKKGRAMAPEETDVANSLIDDILSRTAHAMKGCGNIPAEMTDIIAELEKPMERVYDWKRAFRRYMGNSYSEARKSTRRKESRRFPGAAGSAHEKKARILVGIDTSGSVSDSEVQEFFSELTYMYKAGADIHIIECDAAIQREYDYSPGLTTEVQGRGGTSFMPVINYYKKHYKRYDTLVYFTDGEAPLNFIVPQNNMLWVISSQGSENDYPGKAIYIPKQNNK